MPGRAKPDNKKRQEYVEIKDKWMDRAVEMYKSEQEKMSGEKRLGLVRT
jgi:hypothetical protein